MSIPKSDKIWFNGKLVGWDEAQIHVLSHVVHYGSSVFEGIRCYNTVKGPAVFRLEEHISRLFDSAKIYRMEIPYSQEEVCKAVLETIKVNGLQECYIRPVAYRGYGSIGVLPFECPVDLVIAVWEWGKYLGPEALEKGVSVCTSSWNRMAPNTFPSLAKAGGNYLNSQLVKMEAVQDGYDEGIVLGTDGLVSEGSGENIFVVKNGTVYTPSSVHAILPGLTRHTAIELIRERGIKIVQRGIPREYLYIADEIFFTGTAAEITPVRAVDKIDVGTGKRGEFTAEIQEEYFKVVNAEREDRMDWLSFV
jgi:branched-chain amino acid aminotransferase